MKPWHWVTWLIGKINGIGWHGPRRSLARVYGIHNPKTLMIKYIHDGM